MYVRFLLLFTVALATEDANFTLDIYAAGPNRNALRLKRKAFVFNGNVYTEWTAWHDCAPKDCLEYRYRHCKGDSYKKPIQNIFRTPHCPFRFIAETRKCRDKSRCITSEGPSPVLSELTMVCGYQPSKPMTKIIGGTEAKPHAWPWHVGLFTAMSDGNGGKMPFCGGTLIASKWVLTAAHCITDLLPHKNLPTGRFFDLERQTGLTVTARAGEHSILEHDDHEVNVEVKRVILHERFRSSFPERGHDIALLELASKVTLYPQKHINAACVPNPDTKYPSGKSCFVAGWGRDSSLAPDFYEIVDGGYGSLAEFFGDEGNLWERRSARSRRGSSSTILREAKIQIQELRKCRSVYRKLNPKLHVCAGLDGKDTCMGDSGGGLFCKEDAKFHVFGVTSFGAAGKCGQSPGVYTNVANFASWIHKHVR